MSWIGDSLRKLFHRAAQPGADTPDALTDEKRRELMSSTSHTTLRDTLRAAWQIGKPYWQSKEKWKALGMLGGVVALTLAQVYCNVRLNSWRSDFYDALQNYNGPEFYKQLGVFTGWAFAWCAATVQGTKTTQKLQMHWREWMTKQSIDKWINKKAFYDIQQNGGTRADNPDQRISEDLNAFTDRSLNMSTSLLNASVSLASFVGVLYKMSPALHFNVASHAVTVPHYLVPAALGYSLLGSLAMQKIGKALPALNFQQQRKEAEFRAAAMRVRENAESVALYGGEAVEKKNLTTRFNSVVRNTWDIIKKQRTISYFNSAFAQAAVIFPYIAVAPQYFAKTLKLGQLMQAASAFNYVQDSCAWFVNSFNQFADWKAATDRISGFRKSIEASNEKHDRKVQQALPPPKAGGA